MTIKENSTRLLASAGTAIITYLLAIIPLTPLTTTKYEGMMGMMSFANPNYITLHIAALLIGGFAGMSLYVLTKPKENTEKNELNIIKKALSADEKSAIEQIEKEEEITQDSLRFRLGWSKAKTSTILTNLDKIGVIQRQRQGKTYNIIMPKNKV